MFGARMVGNTRVHYSAQYKGPPKFLSPDLKTHAPPPVSFGGGGFTICWHVSVYWKRYQRWSNLYSTKDSKPNNKYKSYDKNKPCKCMRHEDANNLDR